MTRAEWIKEIDALINKIEFIEDDNECLELLEEVVGRAETAIDTRKEDLADKEA